MLEIFEIVWMVPHSEALCTVHCTLYSGTIVLAPFSGFCWSAGPNFGGNFLLHSKDCLEHDLDGKIWIMCFQIYVIFSSSVIRPAKDPLWRVISSTRLTTCYPILAWFDMVFNIGNLIRGMWLDEKPPVRKLNLLFFLTAIAEGGPWASHWQNEGWWREDP